MGSSPTLSPKRITIMQTVRFVALPVVALSLWFALAVATLSSFVSLEQTRAAVAPSAAMLAHR
jgi:hypothetical protein